MFLIFYIAVLSLFSLSFDYFDLYFIQIKNMGKSGNSLTGSQHLHLRKPVPRACFLPAAVRDSADPTRMLTDAAHLSGSFPLQASVTFRLK